MCSGRPLTGVADGMDSRMPMQPAIAHLFLMNKVSLCGVGRRGARGCELVGPMTDPFDDKTDGDWDENAVDVARSSQHMSRVEETTTIGESASAASKFASFSAASASARIAGIRPARAEPACPRCTMEDSPATRQATKARIGPWYVLQSRNPAQPGMKYATLLALINKGHVSARSIIRGPTTHQMWRYAAHVRGISREFGLCFSCGGAMDRGTSICPHCQRSQDAPPEPDVLLESRPRCRSQLQLPSSLPRTRTEPVATSYAARMRIKSAARAGGS